MQGILFTPDNHKAIRDNLKTQTRRLGHLKEINKEPGRWKSSYTHNDIPVFSDEDGGFWFSNESSGETLLVKPRYRVGETVYIKESHRFSFAWDSTKTRDIPPSTRVYYKDSEADIPLGRWRSPMFMPAWAARDYIKITDVRPERLREITEEDIIAEGIERGLTKIGYYYAFGQLWNSINKTYPYDLNPWCWRICFNLIEGKR